MKILFILKKRNYHKTNIKSYGLINSAKLVTEKLDCHKYETKVVTVIDANGIDKEVYEYKPDVVVIEALWVLPAKLKELIEIKRYKHIKWIVRIHSDAGFLSAETLALFTINGYIGLKKDNLFIAPNSKLFCEYISNALNYKFTYLPNIVPVKNIKKDYTKEKKIINIGCLGALRILKNQLFQAICAIKAADLLDKTLNFHITVDSPSENNSVLKNLEELFANSKHNLIKHSWTENDEFQNLIKTMDIGIQLSFSETFNIVTADFVNNDKLILVSDIISWMPDILKTSTFDYDEVTQKIIYIYKKRNSKSIKRKSQKKLKIYEVESATIWNNFLQHLF